MPILITKLGIDVEALRQPLPAIYKEYKTIFLGQLRALRYQNIVLERCKKKAPTFNKECRGFFFD
mgnify:CR=1 FL=1